MTKLNRRTVLIGAGAGLLSGCTEGFGVADLPKKQPKGGIGGTGIVGTLTDFGSLMVNGLRVTVPAGLAVEAALGQLADSDLALGHTLTIEAATTDDGLSAKRVRVVQPVIGPVQSVSADGRALLVAGVRVEAERGMADSLSTGQNVAVSGVWRRTRVVASRIDPVATDAPVVAAGTVRYASAGSAGAQGIWTIGTVPIMPPEGAAPEAGGFATAQGVLRDGTLIVEDYQPGRFTGAAGPLASLSVEGYFAPTSDAPFHTIDGLGHQLSARSSLAGLLGNRVLLSGGYDGRFVVDEGLVLAETSAERRRQLKSG